VVDPQRAEPVYIQVVSRSRTVAVMSEFAVVDRYAAGRIGCRKQPFLVIMEVVVVEDEITAFVPNPGTVAVINLCTRDGEVVDRVISAGDEDGLAIWDQPRADHVHHATDALQRDVRIDRRVVVDVGAGLNVDRVAVLRTIN